VLHALSLTTLLTTNVGFLIVKLIFVFEIASPSLGRRLTCAVAIPRRLTKLPTPPLAMQLRRLSTGKCDDLARLSVAMGLKPGEQGLVPDQARNDLPGRGRAIGGSISTLLHARRKGRGVPDSRKTGL
jgi:hypothetical protein